MSLAQVLHLNSSIIRRDHTSPEVVSASLNVLFNWANKEGREFIDDCILSVLKGYKPNTLNVLSNRTRAEQVGLYVKQSKEDPANLLAYILSSGGNESNSFNTLLISHLTPLMLQKVRQVDVNLLSLRQAVEQSKFNSVFYSEEAKKFALNEDRFEHIYSKKALKTFNDAMYKWAEHIDRKTFYEMVKKVVGEYTPYSFNFLSKKTRANDILPLFEPSKGYSNERILGMIFSDGGFESNSLNTTLFKRIFPAIKLYIQSNTELQADFGQVLQIKDIHEDYYLKSVKGFAKEHSFDKKAIDNQKEAPRLEYKF